MNTHFSSRNPLIARHPNYFLRCVYSLFHPSKCRLLRPPIAFALPPLNASFSRSPPTFQPSVIHGGGHCLERLRLLKYQDDPQIVQKIAL